MIAQQAIHTRRQGQILIMTLLALILLASMVFFVFNTGEQVNRRVTVQNAADSAAIAGSAWFARTMNVVAMNNVAQTRLITLAAELDSLPLAVELTYNELTAIIAGLEAQLPTIEDQTLRQGIEWMLYGYRAGDFRHPGLVRQRELLEPLYQSLVVSGYDIRQITHWRLDGNSADVPHGQLWVGVRALEDFNRAAVETAGILAQYAACRMAVACMTRQPDGQLSPEVGAAFLAPVLPVLPAKLGVWRDFHSPIMNGTPPERTRGTTSEQFQRGPYDQLYRWRRPVYDVADARTIVVDTGRQPTYVPPRRGNPSGASGQPGLSPAPPGGQGGYYRGGTRTIHYPGPQIGWRPYGVYDWSLTVGGDQNIYPNSGMVDFCNNYLPDLPSNLYPGNTQEAASSNFLKRMQVLTRAKLDYMFGQAAPGSRRIHRPNWIVSYDAAKQAATANPAAVKYTWLWILRIRSSLPPTDPGYRQVRGTFYPPADSPHYNPYSCPLQRGWLDPADPANRDKFGDAVQIAPGVWQTDWTYQVDFDLDIGLQPTQQQQQPPQPGQPAPQPTLHTVYVRDQFVFFGIDVGASEPIRNPGNWNPGEELPRPYLLDLDIADYRSEGAREAFSFLGVAQMSSRANLWPARFQAGDPFGNVIGLAEAFVFNNQSHDLWTQDWQARLQPIRQWNDWIQRRMQASPGDFATVRPVIAITEDGYMRTHQSLQNYPDEMVEQVQTH